MFLFEIHGEELTSLCVCGANL